MSNCKYCETPIETKEGRRPREFCDNKGKCRNAYYRSKTPKTIPISTYNDLKVEFEAYKKEAEEKYLKLEMRLNSSSNEGKKGIVFKSPTPESFDGEIVEEPNAVNLPSFINKSDVELWNKLNLHASEELEKNLMLGKEYIPEEKKADILKQIAYIKAEVIPPERNTSLGRKVWQNEQARKIEELRKLL